MNFFSYNNYYYFTKSNTLSKKDINNIFDYIIKDLKKDINNINNTIIENTKNDIKRNAKKYLFNKIKYNKFTKTIDINLINNKNMIDTIYFKSKLINFKFYDIIKYTRDYTKLIQKYNKPIQCVLNMSGYSKATWNLQNIDNDTINFNFNRNISSILQIKTNKINIIDNTLYIYYFDKPYTFDIIDNDFLQFLKENTVKKISGVRGTIKKALQTIEEVQTTQTIQNQNTSSIDTPIKATDDKIKEAYEELKKQNFDNCTFEILGSWLWVTTLNEQAKNYLLQRDFKFSLQHLKFYLHYDNFKKHNNKIMSYDKIKELYGGVKNG